MDVQQSTGLCVRLLETWAAGWAHGMPETPTKDDLTSQNGKYSTPNETPAMPEEMSGMEKGSDDAGHDFGVHKMNEANNQKAKPINVMGHAVAQISKGIHPAGSNYKTWLEGGHPFFDRLDREEHESLVEFARCETSNAAKVDESDFKKYLESRYERGCRRPKKPS